MRAEDSPLVVSLPDGTPLLRAHPTGPPPGAVTSPAPETLFRLSRFALIRREEGAIIVESPVACAQVTVHHRALMPVLFDLGEALTCAEIARRSPDLPEQTIAAALALLCRAGLVRRAESAASFEEDTAPGPAMWAFHDLLFHGRTRLGLSVEPLGKTYPFRDIFEPPPALKPATGAARVKLPEPDLARLTSGDPPLAAVVEARRSTRRYKGAPLSIEALGELLFRTLRLRGLSPPSAERVYESSDRPYPSGGACYPLEVYLAVDRCRGLDPGVVRYVPEEHALERVCGRSDGVDRLLKDAADAAGASAGGAASASAGGAVSAGARPQVLMILTARFGRVSFSYGPLSYSLILKEVGCVFQSVYLAATAMGLGACALGVGDARLFAEVAGSDGLVEASVGEILLGSAADPRG